MHSVCAYRHLRDTRFVKYCPMTEHKYHVYLVHVLGFAMAPLIEANLFRLAASMELQRKTLPSAHYDEPCFHNNIVSSGLAGHALHDRDEV